MDKLSTTTALWALSIGMSSFAVEADGPQRADISIEKLGNIEVIKDGEHRLGANERMFLIENQWEYDRCKLLMPKLAEIDVHKESLLVIMSWKSRARSLQSVSAEGDTMVVRVSQQKPPRWSNGFYHPPDFQAFKLPRWPGPVRFEVNGKPQFTIVRGKALEERSAELWEELLRVHSGGDATMPQIMAYFERQAPDIPPDQIWQTISKDTKKFRTRVNASLDDTLFRELIDLRAEPAIPRIFALIESMGANDDSFRPAYMAVVGIGGTDVVGQCKKALSSWNPRSRHAAMLILRDLGLPESRSLAHAHLVDFENPAIGRTAMTLLHRLGISKEDVPAMVAALNGVEAYFRTSPSERPNAGYTDDVGYEVMVAIGKLGPSAKDALPVLERIAGHPEFPTVARKNAQDTIEKLR